MSCNEKDGTNEEHFVEDKLIEWGLEKYIDAFNRKLCCGCQ